MRITAATSLPRIAAAVGATLRRHGIKAVLTGGACASLHTGGAYSSADVDFILSGRITQARLDEAMSEIGFVRDGDRYTHPRSDVFVEFPRGPLAVGSDDDIDPVLVAVGPHRTLALSATDSCRDRLAAFYHWNDRQSLAVAVAIARRNRLHLDVIRRWSRTEGHEERFEEFLSEVDRKPRRH